MGSLLVNLINSIQWRTRVGRVGICIMSPSLRPSGTCTVNLTRGFTSDWCRVYIATCPKRVTSKGLERLVDWCSSGFCQEIQVEIRGKCLFLRLYTLKVHEYHRYRRFTVLLLNLGRGSSKGPTVVVYKQLTYLLTYLFKFGRLKF